MTKISDALQSFNTWWELPFTVAYKEREVYKEIKPYLKLPMMIALSGLRRVGKSMLMLKVVEDYVKGGFNPRRILYFSFDDFRDTEPTDIIKEYEKMQQLDIRKGEYLFLFDEVQKINDWQDKIKMIYDLNKGRIKILLSGSESLFIKKRAKESLAGRIFQFEVNQLTFSEFITFKGQKTILENLHLHSKQRLALFEEYLHTQGFPELVDITDKEVIRRYIREGIIDKVIYKDIPQLFKIEDITVLEAIINILIEEPGQILELSAMASELKITRQTLSNYLRYLEESLLLRKLYNYSRNKRKSERKLKRYYPTIASVDLLFRADDLSRSKALEWLIANRLDAKFFWRDAYKNEVDVVIGDKKPMPVEIKFGKISTNGISAFMREFSVERGVIASYDTEKEIKVERGTISVIPGHRLLLEPQRLLLDTGKS
ncbi:MAG: ATP-binding protein [Candidatus Micrarchaeaceae archaeon]